MPSALAGVAGDDDVLVHRNRSGVEIVDER